MSGTVLYLDAESFSFKKRGSNEKSTMEYSIQRIRRDESICKFCECKYMKQLKYEIFCSLECGMGFSIKEHNKNRFNLFNAKGHGKVSVGIHRSKDDTDIEYWEKMINLYYFNDSTNKAYIQKNILSNLSS